MRASLREFTLGALLLTLPVSAHAQNIPTTIVVMALSPLLVFSLAAALGIVSRNWKVGAAHAALIAVWILLFGIASYWVENDYVIWTPLLLYGIHAIALIVLIARGATGRAGNQG